MPRISWQQLHDSTVSFVASMLALYVAMSIGLNQPYWAMMTAYIVSNPMVAAVRSKAVYRLGGTLLGAAAAVVMVPRLINTPMLLCLAMALWVGACLAISLLDRSPRSYVMMLSGYTAAIIGFTGISAPGAIFDLALLRVQEIVIGITCATVIHSLWFPRSVDTAIRARIESWLDEASQWATEILTHDDPLAANRGRARLAAAASEIHQLATHLPFDTVKLRETTAVVRALHDRILLLIPLLSSLSDRVAVLRTDPQGLDADSRAASEACVAWIADGAPAAATAALRQRLAAASTGPITNDWLALNRLGLLTRLEELVTALADARALLGLLHAPHEPLPASVKRLIRNADARPLHQDPGMALLSGMAATLTILITSAVWIGLGWKEGGASAMLAAVVCSLFATMDDPVPAIKVFGITALLAFPMSGFYLFYVFPSINAFPLLVMTLAPTLILLGALTHDPRYAAAAITTLLTFCNSMAIQEHITTDFANFLNFNLSQFFGLFTAIYVIRSMRSMSAEASIERLFVHTRRKIAQVAGGRGEAEPAAFASHMVDRLGLLAPRLAATRREDVAGFEPLSALRVGMDIVTLQNHRGRLAMADRHAIDALLNALAGHFAQPATMQGASEALRTHIDRALQSLVASTPARATRPLLAALLGLRRHLFPRAQYQPDLVTGTAS